jgi:hypothetical protein
MNVHSDQGLKQSFGLSAAYLVCIWSQLSDEALEVPASHIAHCMEEEYEYTLRGTTMAAVQRMEGMIYFLLMDHFYHFRVEVLHEFGTMDFEEDVATIVAGGTHSIGEILLCMGGKCHWTRGSRLWGGSTSECQAQFPLRPIGDNDTILHPVTTQPPDELLQRLRMLFNFICKYGAPEMGSSLTLKEHMYETTVLKTLPDKLWQDGVHRKANGSLMWDAVAAKMRSPVRDEVFDMVVSYCDGENTLKDVISKSYLSRKMVYAIVSATIQMSHVKRCKFSLLDHRNPAHFPSMMGVASLEMLSLLLNVPYNDVYNFPQVDKNVTRLVLNWTEASGDSIDSV